MMICRRLSEERRDMRSYLLLHAGFPLFFNTYSQYTDSFQGLLTALCRPQVRGRQCAVNGQVFIRILYFIGSYDFA